jgi:hypothetical protein
LLLVALVADHYLQLGVTKSQVSDQLKSNRANVRRQIFEYLRKDDK